jgi:ankyrin repeat protein
MQRFVRILFFCVIAVSSGAFLYCVTFEAAKAMLDFAQELKNNQPFTTRERYLGGDTITQEYHGFNPLLIAAYFGSLQDIEFLLKKNQSTYLVDLEGKDVLRMLAGSVQAADNTYSAQAIKLILGCTNQDNGARSLTLASRLGHVYKVTALLEKVSVYDQSSLSRLRLLLNGLQSTYKKIEQRLITARDNPKSFILTNQASLGSRNTENTEALLDVVGQFYQDIVVNNLFNDAACTRLKSLPSFNSQDLWGYSPLMIAARGKNKDAFNFLINQNSSISAVEWRFVNFFGDTALSLAAGNDFYQGLDLGGMDGSIVDGLTSAEVAREQDSLYLVKQLYTIIPKHENGDPDGVALAAALRAGFYTVVDLLLQEGYYTREVLQKQIDFLENLQKKYTEILSLLDSRLQNLVKNK